MLEVDVDSEEKYKHVSALKAHVGKSGKLSCTRCSSTSWREWVSVMK